MSKEKYYQEKHRPQFHFSPEANWMNDPNGMVYLDGEYHLFYQYYPDSTIWGPMHWGHAVSKDLVIWEHLPIALYPDDLGHIFSGSAVIDKENSAGFGKNAMIAIYTYHNMEEEKSGKSIRYQSQAIAYSTDKGRTFTKYEGNPVIPNPGIKDFRDPKVRWDDRTSQWIMVLATYYNSIFYSSHDLKSWTHLSDWGKEYGEHGGVWECPDIFPMVVQETGEEKWVLLQSLNPGGPVGGSGTQYFVGSFDGKNFTLDPEFAKDVREGEAVWLDHGADNYAGVTWSNTPNVDGRKFFIAWMSNWQYAQVVPTEKWRSAMTLPRTLELHKVGQDYRLRSMPVEELSKIEGTKTVIRTGTYNSGASLLSAGIDKLKIHVEISSILAKDIQFKFSNSMEECLLVGYNVLKKLYYIDRTKAGINDFEDQFSAVHTLSKLDTEASSELLIYLDHSSVELFVDKGSGCMTDIFFPSEPFSKLELIIQEGTIEIIQGSVTELGSIWNR